jgi:hypothetical protein
MAEVAQIRWCRGVGAQRVRQAARAMEGRWLYRNWDLQFSANPGRGEWRGREVVAAEVVEKQRCCAMSVLAAAAEVQVGGPGQDCGGIKTKDEKVRVPKGVTAPKPQRGTTPPLQVDGAPNPTDHIELGP